MLKKEISDSEKLGVVKSDRARVLYFMMLPHLDALGRLEANTRRIKGQITTMLPYSEKMIQAGLEQLHEAGLLILYTNSDKQYLQYTRFNDFQSLNPEREAKSVIPDPTPEDSREIQITPLKLNEVKSNIIKEKYKSDSDELRLATSLFELIRKRKPDYKEPNLQTWANRIDLMIRVDKREVKKIQDVIEWCQKDSFWQNNILSTEKLRKHFDRLELQSNGNKGTGNRRDFSNQVSQYGTTI